MWISSWNEIIGLKIKVTGGHLYNMNFREKVLFNREIMSVPTGIKEKWVYNEPHSPFSTISTGVVIQVRYNMNTVREWYGKSAKTFVADEHTQQPHLVFECF